MVRIRLASAALAIFIALPLTAPSAALGLTTQRDIVVYGGTPAGVLAAVTAWRANPTLRVTLLEPTRHLGGMMSSGLGWTDIGNKSTLGGYTKEWFDRVQAAEGTVAGRYAFEPRVAEDAFRAMLHTTGVQTRYGERLRESTGVTKSGARITSITMTSGNVYQASTFIDATYEGDLMAQAKVSYVVGRESTAQYGESLAGVQTPVGVITLPSNIYLPLPGTAPKSPGSADGRIQDSNYRICFSSNPANSVPFAKPLGYLAADYAMTLEWIKRRATSSGQAASIRWVLSMQPLANAKWDVNDSGSVSTAIPGLNYAYPEGSYATRALIDLKHVRYTQGLLYFLRYDPTVPKTVRDGLAAFGLCKDEFTDNNNWPRTLYLREGRRMLGQYVLRQQDIEVWRTKTSIIGLASYRVDAHYVSRWMDASRKVWVEGFIKLPYYTYAIPYRVMLPQKTQTTNLLVPVASSASHVAQSSLRMEPQYMIMGEAAGQAAAMTIRTGMSPLGVSDVNVTTLQAKLRAHGVNLTQPTP